MATVHFAFSTLFTDECMYFYTVESLDGNDILLSSFSSNLSLTELMDGRFVIMPDQLLAGLEEFEPGVVINVTLFVDEDVVSAVVNVPGGE